MRGLSVIIITTGSDHEFSNAMESKVTPSVILKALSGPFASSPR
jgi:hypothetical protein